MATGVLGMLEASEETFDHTCSVCRKKNRVSEAVKYCQECHKYLCTSCLDQHNDYMDDHTLVEPSDAGCGVVMPTEKCRRHGQKMIELWCKKHNEVLCNTCAFMDHRSCEEVKFIPGDTDHLLQDAELQETIDGLRRTRERLATLKKERSLAGEELLKVKHKYLEMVEQQKRKIIKIVESLEEAAVGEINVWYSENKSKIGENQDCCDQLERDTMACLQQLYTTSENKPQLFVSMKKGQKLLTTTNELVDERNIKVKPDKEYEVNNGIEKYLVVLQSLGSFKKRSPLYKVTGMSKVKVKLNRDSKCQIQGTCLLSDGTILLTDVNNKRLKRLDSSTYTVTDHCDLPESSCGMCCVGPQEVVVCFNNKIQFVNVGKTMTPTKTVKLDHDCFGIAYSDGELFVSGNNDKVYLHNLSGTLLQTISRTPSGEKMLLNTRHLTISGDRIYITDLYMGLICRDRKGTQLFKYTGKQMKGSYGVCAYGRGGVFLCGYWSHNVVQVGADGEELGVVLTQSDGLENPTSVCFDQSNQKLIVTNLNKDEIMVYDLV